MQKIDFDFATSHDRNSDVLVLTVFNDGKLGKFHGEKLDKEFDGLISHEIGSDALFNGKRGQTLTFAAPADSNYKKIVLLGMGNDEGLDRKTYNMMGAALFKTLDGMGYSNVEILPDLPVSTKITLPEAAANLAAGLERKSYKFDKYKARDKEAGALVSNVTVISPNPSISNILFTEQSEVVAGSFLAADLANEPPNVIYPETMAQCIDEELTPLGVKVRIIHETEMEKLGMNAALAVGQGSNKPPRMVVMEYDGSNGTMEGTPLALVGKGVTFDSGGISLKPGAGMDEMKMDMGGAAAVVGAMRALAGRKANTKVVAIVGLAENMPSDRATKPGDIVTTLGGKTVNIKNTDAEGRLVLVDALTYIQREYKPNTVLDFATLTGACVMAGAFTYSGVFSPDWDLQMKIKKAGEESQELAWPMPLHEDFAKAIDDSVADLSNLANMRWGGASTAAEFLHAHIEEGVNWAHVDVAGPAIPADGISKGYGVELINRIVKNHFENHTPILFNHYRPEGMPPRRT